MTRSALRRDDTWHDILGSSRELRWCCATTVLGSRAARPGTSRWQDGRDFGQPRTLVGRGLDLVESCRPLLTSRAQRRAWESAELAWHRGHSGSGRVLVDVPIQRGKPQLGHRTSCMTLPRRTGSILGAKLSNRCGQRGVPSMGPSPDGSQVPKPCPGHRLSNHRLYANTIGHQILPLRPAMRWRSSDWLYTVDRSLPDEQIMSLPGPMNRCPSVPAQSSSQSHWARA